MQPTQAGVYEIQRGTLHAMTPTTKGKVAFVVQGHSPADASPLATPTACWSSSHISCFHKVEMPFVVGEQVLVLTDDGQAWMDAFVMAVFPADTEAEGYSIPGGSVKVSYELGIKWFMPENIKT